MRESRKCVGAGSRNSCVCRMGGGVPRPFSGKLLIKQFEFSGVGVYRTPKPQPLLDLLIYSHAMQQRNELYQDDSDKELL